MLNCYRDLQSGITSYVGPFPGTAKKLHLYLMPLLINATQLRSTCGMHELLYIPNTLFVNGFV